TAWAYNRPDALGDMIFVKWLIVNKSGKNWEDTYFSIWCDPDLGNAGDDFVGCDTTLGLGFGYNATDTDQNYGQAPPAVGIDFLQGPIVPSAGNTVTLPDGTVLQNSKMLKMTSFMSYNNDDSNQGNPSSGTDVYNYMSGFWRDKTPITLGGTGTNPTNPLTKFMFSGDPETATGWLDANPADRRFMMTTGPFTMTPWVDSNLDGMAQFGESGVQEIVAVVMVARGMNNLNSVTTLKAIDQMGQISYDVDFQIVEPPDAPSVTASGLPDEVVLTWNDRSEYNDDGSPYESVDFLAAAMFGNTVIIDNTIKVVDDSTYNFYGYTVYQYSDISGSNPVKVQSWDIGKNADAVSYSKQRYIHILTNHNPEVDEIGAPLVDNKEYYFGVVAQSYLEFGSPSIITSNVVIQKVRPVGAINGTDLSSVSADTARHISGVSDGKITIEVIDPSAVTGDTYNVTFNANQTWNLVNITDGMTVLANQTNQNGDDAYIVVDGILVRVIGSSAGISKIVELNPSTLEIYDNNLWGSLNNYGRSQYWPVFILTENVGTTLTRVDRFGLMSPKNYDIIFTDTDSTLIWNYSTDEVLKNSTTSQPAYAPFTVWRIDLDSTRTRLPVTIIDADGDGKWNRSISGVYGPAFEMLYIYDNAEYKPSDVATYISTNDGTSKPGFGPYGVVYPAINRFMINMYTDVNGYAQAGDLDADGYFYGPPHAGEYIRIITNKPNTSSDVFSFTTTAPSHFDIAKGDVNDDKSVNVADVVTLINHILSIALLSGEQEYAADVNNDLYLNVADVVGIINKTLGRSKSLSKTTTPEAATLYLPEKAYSTDNIVTLPVTIEPNCALSGFQIELSYDPNRLRPLSLVFKDNDSKLISMFRTTESGKVIYVLYDPKGGSIQTSDLPDFRFERLNAGDDQPPSIELVNFVVSDESGQSQTLGIGNRTSQVSVLPDKFALHPCFPNPFNAQTNIRYDLPEEGRVTIQLYNLMGQRVRTLIDRTQPAGSYSLVWDSKNDDGTAIASGIYFLRFKAGSFSKLEKVTLLK
ncbi:MAG: FlgD immunoglobulin-like domain containing protein, partial [Candidatus Marinimicrobia bacterium]|nr:FlgD immunoglobulin-like domain containing protein [Candidatus Neomarinimicrobiota bacterium]